MPIHLRGKEACIGRPDVIRLRSPSDEDGVAILAALQDARTGDMLGAARTNLLSEAGRLVAHSRIDNAPGHRTFVIEVAGYLAGCIGLQPHAECGGLALSFWLTQPFQGRGIALTALREALREVLATGEVRGIHALVSGDNPAASRILGQLGFVAVGRGECAFAAARGVSAHAFWLDRRCPAFTLETRRLVLTAPYAADIPRLVSFLADLEVARQTARVPHPYTRADAEAFIAGKITGDDQLFALRLKDEDGALIGGAGFRAAAEGGYELGYWLGRPYWGSGLATEAARAVIDLLFSSTEVAELHASAHVMNGGSRRVLEKCGFQQVGSGLVRSQALGGAMPVDRFRLDRRTWTSILAWRPATRHDATPRDEVAA